MEQYITTFVLGMFVGFAVTAILAYWGCRKFKNK